MAIAVPAVIKEARLESAGRKNVRLALTLRDFPTFAVDPAHVRQPGPGHFDSQVNGRTVGAVVIAGRAASRADLHALSQLISSVRFPR